MTTLIYQILLAAATVLALALGGFYWSASSDLSACKKTSKEQGETIADLKATSRQQTLAIDQMVIEGQAAQQTAASALAKARQVSQGRQAQINALQARILAAANSDCGTAMVEIRGELR